MTMEEGTRTCSGSSNCAPKVSSTAQTQICILRFSAILIGRCGNGMQNLEAGQNDCRSCFSTARPAGVSSCEHGIMCGERMPRAMKSSVQIDGSGTLVAKSPTMLSMESSGTIPGTSLRKSAKFSMPEVGLLATTTGVHRNCSNFHPAASRTDCRRCYCEDNGAARKGTLFLTAWSGDSLHRLAVL